MQVTIFLLTSVILFSTGFQNLYCLFLGPACGFLKKLNIELPYDPAIPLLGIYLEKNIIRKDIYTPMFSAALFIIAKTWKQSICPSTDERIKKMWYIYAMEYYLDIKKNEIMPFEATRMDVEIITLSEISQRKTNII